MCPVACHLSLIQSWTQTQQCVFSHSRTIMKRRWMCCLQRPHVYWLCICHCCLCGPPCDYIVPVKFVYLWFSDRRGGWEKVGAYIEAKKKATCYHNAGVLSLCSFANQFTFELSFKSVAQKVCDKLHTKVSFGSKSLTRYEPYRDIWLVNTNNQNACDLSV